MALLGPEGLERVAAQCHANTNELLSRIMAIPGVERVFTGAGFHEAVVHVSIPVNDLLRAMEAQGILAGYNLTHEFPELGECMLVCATETRTSADLEKYVLQLERVVSKRRLDPPCAQKVSS
jgi:glycine dehydrogenase subunit 1